MESAGGRERNKRGYPLQGSGARQGLKRPEKRDLVAFAMTTRGPQVSRILGGIFFFDLVCKAHQCSGCGVVHRVLYSSRARN